MDGKVKFSCFAFCFELFEVWFGCWAIWSLQIVFELNFHENSLFVLVISYCMGASNSQLN